MSPGGVIEAQAVGSGREGAASGYNRGMPKSSPQPAWNILPPETIEPEDRLQHVRACSDFAAGLLDRFRGWQQGLEEAGPPDVTGLLRATQQHGRDEDCEEGHADRQAPRAWFTRPGRRQMVRLVMRRVRAVRRSRRRSVASSCCWSAWSP